MAKFTITPAVQIILNDMMVRVIKFIDEKIFNLGNQKSIIFNINFNINWHSSDIDYFNSLLNKIYGEKNYLPSVGIFITEMFIYSLKKLKI